MILPFPRTLREVYGIFTCEVKGCTLRVSTPGGQYTTHKCPYEGGETRISWMAYGPTLLQQTWDDADVLFLEYMQLKQNSSDTETPEQQRILWRLEGKMRGISSVLARWMVPHMRTEDDVVRELVKRHKMKQAGEEYETPGLGSRKFEPPPGDNKLATRPAPAKMKIPDHLTPDDIQDIKTSKFPIELLASTYDITPPVVKAIQSQP